MSKQFKILMVLLIVPLIGYGISYVINESPIAVNRVEKYPRCTLDCGISPNDYIDSIKHKGFPWSYQDTATYLPGILGRPSKTVVIKTNNGKLVENYESTILIIELVALLAILWRIKHANPRD